MNSKLRDLLILVAVTSVLLISLPGFGQVLKGSISGTVVDPQGAVISGAQVKATSAATGTALSTKTDNAGLFRFNLIPAGTYKIEISAQGFKTTVQNSVPVSAGADQGLGTLALSIGEPSTTVEVTGVAPLIEASQAQVTNTFTGVTLQTFAGIQENQGLDNLALFVPGIASSRDANFSNTNGGQGFSSNGLRGRNNDQEIDGQNNNDNAVTGPALFVSDPNFVQQYVIVTNNFGPEFGRNAGSVVNIITASGTNNWHGSVYGNENNSILNGLPVDEKLSGLTHPPRANDEFTGGTIGGPWIKNKLFFFFGFDNEIVSTSTTDLTSLQTPTPAGLATLAACFPTGQSAIAVANISKFGPYGISAGNPTPVSPGLSTVNGCANVETGGVSRLLSTPSHAFNWVVREDWQLGSNDTVSGRYLFNRSNFFNTNAFGTAPAGYPANVPALSQIVLISETHNFSPRMVNETRIGFDRLNVEFGGNSFGTFPGIGQINNAVTSIAFTDGNTLGFGVPSGGPQGRFSNTWQAQDNWNYLLGKHQLKAGVNYTHEQAPNTFLPAVNGIYSFSGLDAYFTNTADRNVNFTVGDPELGLKEDDTFLYFGDDWKIKRNLTLNLGLTWSYFSQPVNQLNQLTTQNENGPNPLFGGPLNQRIFPALPVYKNTFGPSIGFAYSPEWGGFLTGHGKTVIRGGFRLSYDPPNLNIFLNNYDSAPSTLAAVLPGSPVPLNPIGSTVQALLKPSVPLGQLPQNFPQALLPSNFRPDNVKSWSFGVERSLGKNSAVEVRYVGNHASDLFQNVNANPFVGTATDPGLQQLFPNLVPAGVTGCTTPGPGLGRVNCNQGLVQLRSNAGYSSYNALQTNYRATNLFHQLTMTASYTRSKTLDNSGEIFNDFGAGNTTALAQNPFNTSRGEYSLSGLDFPNVFSIQLTEQLPFFKEQHGLLGHILGGWSGAINYIYSSGQNYTPFQLFYADLTNQLTQPGFSGPNPFDGAFEPAFNNGVGNARPFLGNPNAPANAVGIFEGDACNLASQVGFFGGVGCTGGSPTQLLSLNALNGKTPAAVPVTNQQVHFIANTAVAEQIFGTPYGNVPRSALRDSPINVSNISIYKNIKMREHISFEFHATMLNAFNHSNFAGVVPFVENAGLPGFGNGFALPNQDTDQANGLTNEIPGQNLSATRRVYFGGTFRF
jgi:Carboxypeptidase regulatory-like domain